MDWLAICDGFFVPLVSGFPESDTDDNKINESEAYG